MQNGRLLNKYYRKLTNGMKFENVKLGSKDIKRMYLGNNIIYNKNLASDENSNAPEFQDANVNTEAN